MNHPRHLTGNLTVTRLAEMVDLSPVACVLTNPCLDDNPIVECNRAFVDLTGYPREEAVGRNCRFLSGAETDPDAQMALREAIARKTPTVTRLLNYRKDGSAFWNSLMIAPAFDDRGELVAFLGSQTEVSTNPDDTVEKHVRRARRRLERLTARQRQVLVGMAAGKQIKQIAYDLGLHERTVKLHRAAALKALGVKTAVEALRLAIKAGF